MLRKINLLWAISFLFIACSLATAKDAKIEKNEAVSKKMPTVNCWCRMKVGEPDWEGRDWDLGSIATYTGLAPQTKQGNKDDCRSKCSRSILDWYNQNKDTICQKFGGAGNTFLIGQSELANNGPDVVETLPVKCCEKPAVIRCPPNTDSQFGYDGTARCKQQLGCKITPAPANGTPIGNNWGFFWEGFIIQFISPVFFQPKEIRACENMTSNPTNPRKVADEVLKSSPTNLRIEVQPTPEPNRKPEK
jgi:hypothetical protein